MMKKVMAKVLEKSAKETEKKSTPNGPFNPEEVKRIAEQIGIIYTSFPENKDPEFEGEYDFPLSYYTIKSKERLLLLFAENLRRQYCVKYPDRMPLVLAISNECGTQVK